MFLSVHTIYMDNEQQRMYEITIKIPDNPFFNLTHMFYDYIDRIISEIDGLPTERVHICLFLEESFVFPPFKLGCHVTGDELLGAIEDNTQECIIPGTIILTITISRDD